MKTLLLVVMLWNLPLFAACPTGPICEAFGYTLAADLNTQNGDTGWTAGWVKDSGDAVTVVTAPSGMSGTAVQTTGTSGGTVYRRGFTNSITNTYSFDLMVSIQNPNGVTGYGFVQAGVVVWGAICMGCNTVGQVSMANNGGYVDLGAYSNSVKVTVTCQLDAAMQANKYRCKADAGAYSAWQTVNGGTLAAFDQVRLLDSSTNAHTITWDSIGGAATTAKAALLMKAKKL